MSIEEKEDFHKGQEVYYFNENNKEWSKVVIDEISNGFYNIRYSDGRLEMSITSTSLTKNKRMFLLCSNANELMILSLAPNVSPKDNYVCMVCLSSMSRKFNPLVQCSECKLYAHRVWTRSGWGVISVVGMLSFRVYHSQEWRELLDMPPMQWKETEECESDIVCSKLVCFSADRRCPICLKQLSLGLCSYVLYVISRPYNQ